MPTVSTPLKPRVRPGALSSTEESILRAAADLPVFCAEDMTRLLSEKGSQGSHYRALLKSLSVGTPGRRTEYLLRLRVPHAPGNVRILYTLSRRGAGLLKRLGVDADFWYRPWKASHRSVSFWQHHHAITRVLVALYAFTRSHPAYQVIEARTGFSIARNPPRLTRGADGQETSATVIPDVWVNVERSGGSPPVIHGFPLWIEVDCGTETKAMFQQLVLNRINFISSKGYKTYFGTPALLCCYLAVGATVDYRIARLHTLRTWTAELLAAERLDDDWASIFRFSTIDECLYDTLMIFSDPAWYCVDSDTLVPLFMSPEPEEKS